MQAVMAAVKTGASKMEMREFPMPDIPEDAALMKVEVAGICGTDVKIYKQPLSGGPVIMGHENIGTIAKAGRKFTERKGLKEGDQVFLEHYVSCGQCEWCHLGQYRHCEATDWRANPNGIRYGYTSSDRAPHLWGGFAPYAYLPWNSVLHKLPRGVSMELAGIVTPMANGIEWALFDAQVGYASTVLIQGPGQQGLSQIVACKQAGADLIIVTGTTKDAKRMELAKLLGADYVIDVQQEDPLARIMDVTAGRVVKGVNFVELRDAGDPVEIARRYDEQGADEITFLDITASSDDRDLILHIIEAVASQVFIPLTVGGGVRVVDDVRRLLNAGADKVSINTSAVTNPQLVQDAAKKYGSQCIVVAIDAKRSQAGHWEVFTHGGRNATGLDVVEWACKMQALGAGEILLTSMDRDGTRSGFDLALTSAVSDAVSIPVIASGGVGGLQDLADGIVKGHADAVLAASIFHYQHHSVGEVKQFMAAQGIPMRLV